MNNTFQINRFSKLVKRTFTQHKRTWLILISSFVGLLILNIGLTLSNTYEIYSYTIRNIFPGLFISICYLSPLIFFYNVSHTKKGITEVMLPASTLEKFLHMWLFCIVILPIILILIYFFFDSVAALIYPTYFNPLSATELIKFFLHDTINNRATIYLVDFLFIFHIIFLCNIFFANNKLIKILVIFIIIGFILPPLARLIVPLITTNAEKEVMYRSQIYEAGTIRLKLILSVVFMIASYLILKLKRY